MSASALHRLEKYFISEASVYRLLKGHDQIASPAYIVMKAADELKGKTTAPNQLWQTDFTYLKVIGWGWFYLCTTSPATSSPGSSARGRKSGTSRKHWTWRCKPRGSIRFMSFIAPLLSDNGSSYISADFAERLDKRDMGQVRGAP